MYKYFKESEIQNLDKDLVAKLDIARGIAGTPFIITSGFRTEQHNEDVGGVIESSHLKGLAVDLKCENSEIRFLMLKGIFEAKFNRIVVYYDHIHVDIDPDKPQNICSIGATP